MYVQAVKMLYTTGDCPFARLGSDQYLNQSDFVERHRAIRLSSLLNLQSFLV